MRLVCTLCEVPVKRKKPHTSRHGASHGETQQVGVPTVWGRYMEKSGGSEKVAPTPNLYQSAAAEWVHIDDLDPWENNPHKDIDEEAPKVAKLIVKYGFGTAMLAWLNPKTLRKMIMGGHTRKKAVQILQRKLPHCSKDQRAKWHPDAIRTAEAGMVPVRVRLDLTEKQAIALALADNKSHDWFKWDDHLLAEDLSEFSLQDVGDMGFDVAKYSSDDFGLDDGRSRAGEIKEIDLTGTQADFTMTITGPLGSMQDAVKELRKALGKVPGVIVDVSTTDF